MATKAIPSSDRSAGGSTSTGGPNPQLKSLVYSKYRELLGSYNGKANEILQSYPAYMVKEDKGFDFVDNYGGPPQSTIGSSARRIQAQLPAEPPACVQNAMMRRDKQPFTYTPGGIDLSQIKSPRMAKRISRNAQSEGVSNQPKVSPLAQNNSNSSSNGNSQPAVSPAATLGAAAMGMPFQVFPTGPPAPPPPPPPSMAKRPSAPAHSTTNGNSVTAPPPPPPPVLPPPASKVSPKPQSFEPPPMGCRPEIKIPPNPIANLRKAPRPQPKNDFWIQEYRNEKLNDPVDRPSLQISQPPQLPPVQYSSRDADDEVAKNTQNRTHELTVRDQSPKKRSPSPSNLTKPLENGSRVSSIKTPPVYSQSPVPASLPPPITPTKVSQTSQDTPTKSTLQQDQSSKPRQNSSPSPPKTAPSSPNTPNNNSNNSNRTSPVKPPTAQKPAPQALGSLYIPPVHEVFAHSKQALLNQASPPWMSSRQNSAKEQPEWVHKEDSESLGSKQPQVSKSNESTAKPADPIAAAPASPAKPAPQQKPQPQQQQQQQQPSPPPPPQPTTPVSRPLPVEAPAPQYQQQQQQPPTISQTHYIQLQNPAANRQPQLQQQQQPAMPANRSYPQTPVYAQNQVYTPQPAPSQKERIIPIQMEASPVKAPVSAPAFAPPPYYSPGPQYNNVQSPLTVGYPHSGFTTPTAMFTNPNHFVNQGYNNITYPPTSPQIYQQHHYQQPPSTPQQQQQQHAHMMHQQQRMQQQTPTQQQQSSGGVRIIPIKVEGGETAAATNVRGPLSQTPAIIQSDPRSSNNPQVCNGSTTPNQSRSFRVLQQITDTMDQEGQEAKPATPKPGDEAEGQLRRMQLSNDDKALMNRVKSQVDGEVFLHNEEDPRYRGATIPSKAFRYLQNMTDGAGASAGGSQPSNSSNTGSTNRTNQMFVRNPGNTSESEEGSAQQYVSPSEQRVEEPKKYTGSAIPSRSFKMLQAMTQSSDAPADSNSSDLEGNQNLPCNGDIRYSPYPYPLQPHYCCNPNWHYYDPNNPQYYPTHHPPPPPPPPPHHAPGYYYPQPPPPPPPPPHGHYDRGSAAAAYYAGYMSPHHFYYPPQEPCSPCTPPPYYQLSQQPQIAYCENVVPESPTHTYVITTPPPRIVVTPTPEDSSDADSILNEFNAIAHPLTRSQSSLKRLSERLADFSTSPEKLFSASDADQKVVRCSPISSPLNERYRTYEESTSSAPSSQSECSDSEEEAHKKQDRAATSPKAPQQNGTNGHHSDNEEDESSESEDEETVGYDNNPPEHLPHQLSVIFEEESNYSCSANPSRRASVCSNSSTLSDCSSTLANDLDDDGGHDQALKSGHGNQTDDDIDHLDDEESQESQVSVKPAAETNGHKSDDEDETDEESTEEESEEESTDEESKPAVKQPANQHNKESSEEEECSETDESEQESDHEPSKKQQLVKPIVETVENGDHTDVTVTITIPSMSSKSVNEGSVSKPKQSEDSKPNFTVDYEQDSHVSVSVSLPLKLRPAQVVEQPAPEQEKPKEDETQQEDDEEIDFWSQIGEEDEMSRPRSSYSREFWSSREVSIERDDEEATTADDGDVDFWNNENGPTEALDLWKADPAIGSFLDREKNEISSDSIHFWHSENERMFSDLYRGKRREEETARADENNNASGWNKVEPSVEPPTKSGKENVSEVKVEDVEADSDSSEEESEDDSEEYETTNTSKEESEAEENEPKGVEQRPPVEEPRMPEIVLKKVQAADKVDHKCNEILSVIKTIAKEDDKTLSVRDRISIFEQTASSPVPGKQTKTNESNHHLRPPSGMKLSCDESEAEDDSGVTSDMSKHISEVETDSECFPEMRKMTRYQRAATHSRLFKLLQDESNNGDSEDEDGAEDAITSEECSKTMPNGHTYQNGSESPRPSDMTKYKGSSYEDSSTSIVAPNTATDRRDRLSLPIRHQSSSGIESLSSSTSSASPVSGVTNDKLAEELVQSLLMKKKGRLFRNLPLEKLHAAALKILQEDLESNDTISSTEDNIMTVDSTPALTPQEFKSECPNSYSEYYDTWSELNDGSQHEANIPSKHPTGSRKSVNGWSPRCPRVLSNKSISRLAEVRETETPELPSPIGTTISRSRPPSRASNQSPFPALSAGLIEDSQLPRSGSRSSASYKHFKLNNL
ncbi:protein piccolo-like isoform X3 [Culex pipiens pallens]|uniref:protein piccolo-like isoform X3 n=1 Tax=Culex pipiens pallens TaxID=42434 RepID=UPI001952AC09|nr:protein piccolo-like isoform X3 [Culex pipiens pallens]